MPDFEAFWIPDPGSWQEYYPPEVGLTWLSQRPGRRALIVPTVPAGSELGPLPSGTEVVTPRSRYRRRPPAAASILVCYPYDETLELAGKLRPSAVCVADNGDGAVRAWVAAHEATGLVPADWDGDLPEMVEPRLPDDAEEDLRRIIGYASHNQFAGAGEKEQAIRALRRIDQAHPALGVKEVRVWLLSQPEVRVRGAQRLCKWLDEVRAGVQHRDARHRPI